MLLHELDEDKNPARHYVLGNEYIGLNHNYYLTDEQGSARYYNTGIGRFTQEDVIYNDGLNLYAYCSSNPVMYEDPSGYQSNKNQGNLNPCEITKSAAENSKTEIKAGKKYSKYIKFESINQFSKLQLKIVDFIEYDFEIDEDMIRAKSSVGEIILNDTMANGNDIDTIIFYNLEVQEELICDAVEIKLVNGQVIFLDPSYYFGINIGEKEQKQIWKINFEETKKYS